MTSVYYDPGAARDLGERVRALLSEDRREAVPSPDVTGVCVCPIRPCTAGVGQGGASARLDLEAAAT